MTKLQSQIQELENRLQEQSDPLLRDVLESLRELDRLDTPEGQLDFFDREYCGLHEAAKITGIKYESLRQYATNYVKFPDSRRKKLPCRIFGNGTRNIIYILSKKALKNLT